MGIIAAYMVPHPPLIVPDIGKGEEKKIQKTVDAFLEVARRIGEQRPDTRYHRADLSPPGDVWRLLSYFSRQESGR